MNAFVNVRAGGKIRENSDDRNDFVAVSGEASRSLPTALWGACFASALPHFRKNNRGSLPLVATLINPDVASRAVFKFTRIWKRFGCSTGSSGGLAPFCRAAGLRTSLRPHRAATSRRLDRRNRGRIIDIDSGNPRILLRPLPLAAATSRRRRWRGGRIAIGVFK